MPGKRGAGTGTVRRVGKRYYAAQEVGPREQTETIRGKGNTEAEALDDLRDNLAHWKLEQEHGPRHNQLTTVAEFFDYWVRETLANRVADGSLSATTYQQYARNVSLHVLPHLGRYYLDPRHPQGLTVETVDIWLAKLRDTIKQGKADGNRGRQLAHTALKAGLTEAIRKGIVHTNVASYAIAPTVHKTRREEFSMDMARDLYAAAEDDPVMYPYLTVAFSAPYRPGEILGIELERVLWDRQLLDITRNLVRDEKARQWRLHDLKRHEARRNPLTSRQIQVLRRFFDWRERNREAAGPFWRIVVGPEAVAGRRAQIRVFDLLFVNESGDPNHQQWWQDRLEATCKLAGVPRVTRHELRSITTTLLEDVDVPDRVVDQMAGWSSTSMRGHYTRRLDKLKREAVEALDAELVGV